MKNNTQQIARVRLQLNEALSGVESYIVNWTNIPKDFTTLEELQQFTIILHEMLDSLEKKEIVPVPGLWRIMETWPYKNDLRRKIVEAELAYERLK